MTAKWLFKLESVESLTSLADRRRTADPSKRSNRAWPQPTTAESSAARRAEAKRVQSFVRRGRGR